ncbi:UDP-glycosyltransferase 91C1-like [Iris pallida]|uniref:UDP-glycosyltransferase 91C1-like n=1 Tax=Iris pallida TaxID=29817 RepID=A0AAX6G2W5_IRIPA|nr:UDP-glycosyltransferase 91C1-like [Iris pallida]
MASDSPLHIAVFPWLAAGHLIPFVELSMRIALLGHRISFLSTPPIFSASLVRIASPLSSTSELTDSTEHLRPSSAAPTTPSPAPSPTSSPLPRRRPSTGFCATTPPTGPCPSRGPSTCAPPSSPSSAPPCSARLALRTSSSAPEARPGGLHRRARLGPLPDLRGVPAAGGQDGLRTDVRSRRLRRLEGLPLRRHGQGMRPGRRPELRRARGGVAGSPQGHIWQDCAACWSLPSGGAKGVRRGR